MITFLQFRTEQALKGWVDRRIMLKWLNERREIRPLEHDRRRVLFVENSSGNGLTEDLSAALENFNT